LGPALALAILWVARAAPAPALAAFWVARPAPALAPAARSVARAAFALALGLVSAYGSTCIARYGQACRDGRACPVIDARHSRYARTDQHVGR